MDINKEIRAVLRGFVGGLIATAPMTLTMIALNQVLPGRKEIFPPEQIINQLAIKPGVMQTIAPKVQLSKWDSVDTLAHFSYGAGVGGIYGWGLQKFRWSPLVSGLFYGVIVWFGSYMGWLPLLGWLPPATRQSARRNCLMFVAHLVWGASLGWLTARLTPNSAAAKSQPDLPK